MANNEFTIPIPARLKNVAKGGHVAGTKDIIDDALGKEQSTINQDRIDDIANIKGGSTKSISDLSEDIANEAERASGVEAGLRESIDELGQIGLNPENAISTDGDDFDGDTTAKRSKIPTIGAIIDGNPGVYDVSKRNPTGGPNSDGKFTLKYILENVDTLIPASRRHGGMEICFVHSPDNKYVQFRYTDTSTANADIANVSNWHLEDNPILELYNGGFNSSEGFTPASGLRVRTGLLTGKCTIETNPPYEIFKISLFSKESGGWVQDISKAGTADKYGLTYTNNDNFYIFLFYRPNEGAGYPISNQDNIIKSFVLESNTDIELIKAQRIYTAANPIYLGRLTKSYQVPTAYNNYDVWGISAETGTFTNLGDVVVPPNTVCTLRRHNGSWNTSVIAQIPPSNSVPLYNGGFNSSEGFSLTNLRVRTGLLTGHTTLSVYSGFYVYKISVFDKNTCAFIQDINYYDQEEKNNIDYTNNDNWYIILFAKVSGGEIYAHDNIISDIRTDRQTEVELVKLMLKGNGNAIPLYDGGVDTSGNITTTNLRVRTDMLTGSLTLSVNPPYIIWKIALYDKTTGGYVGDINYYDKEEKNNITYEDYEHYFIVTFANTGNSLPINVKDPIINSLTVDRNTQLELCKDQGTTGLTSDVKTGLATAVGKQNGNSVIINFITDTHYDEFYGSYNMERFMEAVYSGIPTLNIHGGDIISLMDKATVNAVISSTINELPVAKSEKPVIFVNGNHDSGYNENVYISATQFKALYNANIQKANYPTDDVNYFYIDFEVNKLRVFVLDSFNREEGATHINSAYGTTQLTWLYDTLTAMQNGWKVIIFTHTLNAGTRAFELVKAFANKGTTVGSYTFPSSLDVDLVGVVQGHLHQDYYDNSDGFNHIAVTRGWDASNQKYVAFSLFTINLDDGEMFETRIGSGSDRTYTF